MAHLIDGKKWAATSRAETAALVETLKARGVTPGLAVILVGEHPASVSYVRGKEKAAMEVGLFSEVIRLPADITQEALLGVVAEVNEDPGFHGLIVQLPLPDHICEQVVVNAVAPEKDVDGFLPVNVGALSIGLPGIVSCTPLGVMKLLEYEGIDVAGKNAVVIGRSNIVGKPMAQLLTLANATVTTCHSRTKNLAEHTRQADILVVAIGKPGFVTADMIKPGAVVIDVGTNRVDGKLVGDVDFAGVEAVAGAITPVPGGVGPMTIAMLLHNTAQAAAAVDG